MSEDLDPNLIIVPERQRKDLGDLSGLEQSIKNLTQLQPIVCRRLDNKPTLMIGGRRLQACINLGIPVRVDWYEDLDPITAQIAELEENVKREDLTWREHVTTVGTIDKLLRQTNKDWSTAKTAGRLALQVAQTSAILTVYKNLDSSILKDCNSIRQAYGMLQVAAERRAASIVAEIANIGKDLFQTPVPEPNHDGPNSGDAPNSLPIHIGNLDSGSPAIPDRGLPVPEVPTNNTSPSPADIRPGNGLADPPIILNTDFTTWISTYVGPKFNFIHCDFPYDIRYDSYAKSITSTADDYDFTGFWPLLDTLIDNLDKVCSYSAHIMFWFSMEFYERTRLKLESGGLYVHKHPFIWHKTDNSGIIPGRDNMFPRRIYETAFLCSRGKRPLVRSKANAYGAPMADKPVHPSQKPEPVLNFFFEMLVDETTDVLDPTCGSGTALRSAERCGARSVLGLELNADYAKAAEAACQFARKLRNLKL